MIRVSVLRIIFVGTDSTASVLSNVVANIIISNLSASTTKEYLKSANIEEGGNIYITNVDGVMAVAVAVAVAVEAVTATTAVVTVTVTVTAMSLWSCSTSAR